MFETTRKFKTTFRGESESSILVQLEFRGVVFCERKKTGEPEKNLGINGKPAAKSTHIRNRASIEPGPHWGQARALITAPTLSPFIFFASISGYQYTKTEFEKHQVSRSDCASRLTCSGDGLP